MSYPSILEILEKRGLNPNTAPESELRNALWEAFNQDLPEAIIWLRSLVKEMQACGVPVSRNEDPNSPFGKKIARLVGTDIARSIISEKLGEEFGIPTLAFGFYNCHRTKVAPSTQLLEMSAREQILCQNGVLASPDC